MKTAVKKWPAIWLLLLGALANSWAGQPLSLAPKNPHYFLFRGKPTLLITSGEHYGAVLNLDFNYAKYLETLASSGLNGTRTWAGVYCEAPGAFSIADNTLAPKPGRFICPWARSGEQGYANGGNKFDLARWDDAYFKRLKDFVKQASKRGIVVELNLFCPFYEESMWRLSPMNVANNVNNLGSVARTNVYTLDRNGGLLAVQEAMVGKFVTDLKDFDNVYYEICNEPYFGGVTLEWQHHIAGVISETERGLGVKHLISQNIANHKSKVENPHPAVSIFNFHYASPPETVALNYDLNKVIGDNETGFRGTNNVPYRMEAWDFIAAGGGLFNNLDYSFTAGHEDGTYDYPASQPGGGTADLRRQIRFLSELMRRFDFVRMKPDETILQGALPHGITSRAMVKPGRDYLIYVRSPWQTEKGGSGHGASFADGQIVLKVALPDGKFTMEWFDTRRCVSLGRKVLTHNGGVCEFSAPAFEEDVALAIRK